MVYSLREGTRKLRVFGADFALSPDGSRIAVERNEGRMAVYEVPSGRQIGEYVFAHPVSMAEFVGPRLFVLTSDQAAHVLEPGRREAAGK